jgi:hypothetical protein
LPLLAMAAAPRCGRWRAAPIAGWLLAGLGILGLVFAAPAVDLSQQPPYAKYRQLIQHIPRPLPDLLIAHQGINFLYDFATGLDAMAWAPEPNLDRRAIGRVAWGIRAGEWNEYLDPALARPVHLGGDYDFVSEDVWEAFARVARGRGDDDLQARLDDWRNPHRLRPLSLMHNRSR